MNEKLEKVRHTTAHILAQAICELFPGVKLTIGPATETGFYYDVLPPEPIREQDLIRIQERMHDIVQRDLLIEHTEIPKEKARELYKDNPFKLEIINLIPGDTVGLATQDNFYDLCRGGHVDSTKECAHFTLLGISGAYWRGDRNNQALQRIHGTAFLTAKDLRAYKKQREEALKYDHRKLGKELNLFSLQPEAPGFPFFHPKGKAILNALKTFMRSLLSQHDYKEVQTPTMLAKELWEQSGHYAHYKENMYFSEIDERTFSIKPMNCPGTFLIYNSRPRSYRELPLKLFEFGHVHRHELSGVLHGLMRVRAFTIDDTHIFCQLSQLKDQIIHIMELINKTLQATGFESVKIGLSTKPDNAMGSDEVWEQAITSLRDALDEAGYEYTIQEGEGAFYGPKIEVGITDSLGRTWQCGTVQVDFLQPENFAMTYVASSGEKERPVIIHHAIYGSLERFFAILLEHYKGKLPFWLSPVQMRILPVTDAQQPYARTMLSLLKDAGFRVELDTSSDPLSGKIKTAQTERIPWMLIVGDKEVSEGTITIRYRDGGQETGFSTSELIEKAQEATPY